MDDRPLAYTIEAASAVSGIGRTKLYSLIGAGQIEARKVGARTLVMADSLRRYIEALPSATIRTGRRAA